MPGRRLSSETDGTACPSDRRASFQRSVLFLVHLQKRTPRYELTHAAGVVYGVFATAPQMVESDATGGSSGSALGSAKIFGIFVIFLDFVVDRARHPWYTDGTIVFQLGGVRRIRGFIGRNEFGLSNAGWGGAAQRSVQRRGLYPVRPEVWSAYQFRALDRSHPRWPVHERSAAAMIVLRPQGPSLTDSPNWKLVAKFVKHSTRLP